MTAMTRILSNDLHHSPQPILNNHGQITIFHHPLDQQHVHVLQKLWQKMLQTIHTIPLTSYTPQQMPTLINKIQNTAGPILNFCLGVALYRMHTSLFAGFFVAGIILDDCIAAGIKKINDIWQTKSFNYFFAGNFGTALLCGGTFLSLPATYLVGSMLYAASLGSQISKKAQEILSGKI